MFDYVFPHETLHLNGHALDLARECDRLSRRLPRGYGHIADQLRRSSTSVALNIGEAASQWPGKRKTATYRVAYAECGETAVALKLIETLGLADVDEAMAACIQAHRMLRPLAR
ncbi:MAG: four helix bundle protein [Proteobacteria bacterium]|nr:four helix bundle protein [Pseudomonadota bacterium]MCP4920753.1 four helix bundle protein [Pseudomonadota bacterium]